MTSTSRTPSRTKTTAGFEASLVSKPPPERCPEPHFVAVGRAALDAAEQFVEAPGWGHPRLTPSGARLWRASSKQSSRRTLTLVKCAKVISGIDHISLWRLMTSDAMKFALAQTCPPRLQNLRLLERARFPGSAALPAMEQVEAIAWHHEIAASWPLQDRDVCYVTCWRADEGNCGRQIITDTSLDHHPLAPLNPKEFARASFRSVYALDDAGPAAALLTICAEVDPGGSSLPSKLVSRYIEDMTGKLSVRYHLNNFCLPHLRISKQ